MEQQNFDRLVQAMEALAARNQQPIQAQSRTVQILKEISYIREFEGDNATLTQFINVVGNHISAVKEAERPELWQAIYNVKITGRAKELLLHNRPTTWEQARDLLKQHFRPSINYKDIARRITYLKVSSIADLNVKIEELIQNVNAFATYENNQREAKDTFYILIVNRIKQLAIGNLSRDIKDIYDIHKIKEVLYTYIGYDEGNIDRDFRTSRQYSNVNTSQHTQTNYNYRRQNPQLNRPGSAQIGRQNNDRIRQSGQYRHNNNNYNNNNRNNQNVGYQTFNPSGQIRNSVQYPTPMSIGQISNQNEEVHNIEPEFFMN